MSPKEKTPRRYWDACCFIAAMNTRETHHVACNNILKDASLGKVDIVVSALTLAEVVRPKGYGNPLPQEKAQLIKAFFENDYIKMRTVDRVIAEAARDLCWAHPIHPRDAIHIATARDTQCDVFETTDNRLLKQASQIADLQIRLPQWTGQLKLPDGPT